MPYQGDMLIPWRVPFFPVPPQKKTNVLFPGSQKRLKPNRPLLVGGFKPFLKNIRQIGSFPQVGK